MAAATRLSQSGDSDPEIPQYITESVLAVDISSITIYRGKNYHSISLRQLYLFNLCVFKTFGESWVSDIKAFWIWNI